MVQENARNEEAVRSIAGSTVEYDCTLSLKTAPFPLNCANPSTPFAGQANIPLRAPLVAIEFGPSTAAPFVIDANERRLCQGRAGTKQHEHQ